MNLLKWKKITGGVLGVKVLNQKKKINIVFIRVMWILVLKKQYNGG